MDILTLTDEERGWIIAEVGAVIACNFHSIYLEGAYGEGEEAKAKLLDAIRDKRSQMDQVKAMKAIAEPDLDFSDPGLEDRWAGYEELAKEMPDDDPRIEPGYHQYDLDAHTRDVIRAKYMIEAREQLAKSVSILSGIIKGGQDGTR